LPYASPSLEDDGDTRTRTDPVLHLDQLGLQALDLFLVRLPVQPGHGRAPYPAERREHGDVGELVRGQLLVATPDLRDPNFSRTVILMLEHGDEGALGVVLNRPMTCASPTCCPIGRPRPAPGCLFVADR
jgi:hypothetical protein